MMMASGHLVVVVVPPHILDEDQTRAHRHCCRNCALADPDAALPPGLDVGSQFTVR